MLTFQIQQSFFYKKNLIEYMDPIPKTDYMYFKRPSLIIPFSSFYMINMLKKRLRQQIWMVHFSDKFGLNKNIFGPFYQHRLI